MIRSFVPLVATALLAGCGKHPGTYTAAGESATGTSATVQRADAAWAQRLEESKLQESIQAYEEALANDGASRHTLGRLTRAWYFWGDAYTDDKDVKIERWSKAIEYGAQCLAMNEAFRTAIEGGDKEKEAVVHAKKDDVPCLYWTASALGKWGRAMGISRTLKHLPTVRAYMTKVDELDPTYYNHGPARYWAVYYAALPSFAGQDYDKSAEYFETSIAGSPHYLPTRVLRAADLAVPLGNVAQFDADLVHVIGANPNQVPDADVMAENVRDQEKARQLFARRAELFDKKVLEAAGPAPEMPEAWTAPAPEPEPMADDSGTSEGQAVGASEAGTEAPDATAPDQE